MSSKRSRTTFESDNTNPPPKHAPYAIHGTPLPAYDPSARDDGSYLPPWKQEVTDERGRKRLHGAFTGGWSAGYFNTVGSKEGWTPASFVSSRSERRNKDGKRAEPEQRVEDFMDEEDLAQRAEGQKLEARGAFAGLGDTARYGGTAGKGVFADLFRTAGETMGVKLLQRMGWRQGQGIGPKVRRRVKGDTKGEMHLFAPDDSRMISFERKTDRKGLGFVGEDRLGGEGKERGGDMDVDEGSDQDARILQTHRSKILANPKKIKKTGFGMGVLNDTGSDEEDAYEIGPKISYTRIIGGDKKKSNKLNKPKSNNATSTVQTPFVPSKAMSQRTTALAGFRKCHDGRLPLAGFTLPLTPLPHLQEPKYPPPTVPENWSPAKPATSSQQTSTITTTTTTTTPYQSTADAAKASTLTPRTRADILAEPQLPGKSVFDFLTPAARERLASATGKSDLPPARGESGPARPSSKNISSNTPHKTPGQSEHIPHLDPQTAAAALQRAQSWSPYSSDPEKGERYRAFLTFHATNAGTNTGLLPLKPETWTPDDWRAELREFAQAAEVFRPVSGLMAARFTSSSSTNSHSASSAPATLSSSSSAAAAASSAEKEKEKETEDPAEKAARMGMFGPLTRSRLPFYPTRLLCKRFNVRPPAGVDPGGGGGGGDGGGGEKPDVEAGMSGVERGRLEVVSQASLDRMMLESRVRPAAVRGGGGGRGFVSGGVEGGEVHEQGEGLGRRAGPAEMDVERNEALEGKRAGDEVFRAVFGDADDGDE